MQYYQISAVVRFKVRNPSNKRFRSFWELTNAKYPDGHELHPFRFIEDKTNGFSAKSDVVIEIDTRFLSIENAVSLVKKHFA